MESDPGHRMNITWVIADDVLLDPDFDIQQLKNIGSTWGSWRTWRTFGTDNVICHDIAKSRELLQRSLHTRCNLYIPEMHFQPLDRPNGIRLYGGNFLHEVEKQEEIVAMHLTSTQFDIVLLLGFDFSTLAKNTDRLASHRAFNYQNLCLQTIIDNPTVQWVCVDHHNKLDKKFLDLDNLTLDSLEQVLKLTESR
jgi:hypothetical protein